MQSFLFCARLGVYPLLCVGVAQAVTQSLFSVVLQITMASACLGKCFLCSGFSGNTQLDLKRHLTKDHRVTLSHVIESESATLPPYSEADNITEGVPCFLCSSYSGNTWLKMVDHLKNVHAVPRSQVSDTYIGRQAKLEMNEKARTWYKKKQQCVPAVAITESAVTQQPSSADEGATKTNCDGTRWRLCWVQTDENFNPTAPYQLEGGCQTSPAPLQAEVPATASGPTTVETAKEIATSVDKQQKCNTLTKRSLSAAQCLWEQATEGEGSSASVAHLSRDVCGKHDFGTVTVLDNVVSEVLVPLASHVEEPEHKRNKVCAPPHRPKGSEPLMDVESTMSVPFLGVQPSVTQKCIQQNSQLPPKGKCALLKFLRERGERAD